MPYFTDNHGEHDLSEQKQRRDGLGDGQRGPGDWECEERGEGKLWSVSKENEYIFSNVKI